VSVLSNITISQATALGLSTIGRMDYFVDSLDSKLKAYDVNNDLLEDITVLTDLDAYPFTPVVPLNWDGPPMSVQDALDELARRVKDNEEEINLLTTSYNRRAAVIDLVDNTLAPPTEVLNDRYILDFTGTSNAAWDGALAGDIVEFDGALWVGVTPVEGYVSYVDDQNKDALYTDDGSPQWELRTIAVENHNDLQNIQGGAVGDHQHLTTAEKANITGSVTVHSDVNSAGSGDIITTGERNALHPAVSTSDTANIDLSLSTQEISADLTNTGVSAGTYDRATITVDDKGRISAASSNSPAGGATIADIAISQGNLIQNVITSATLTSDVDNWSPIGFDTETDMIRVDVDANNRAVTGIPAPSGGVNRVLAVKNINTASLDLRFSHNDAGSVAANRFLCRDNNNKSIKPNEMAIWFYDHIVQRWTPFNRIG